MPNKQITDLTEQSTGQEDTDVLWIQKAAGGASSSFKVAWSNLFKAKDAAIGSEANGTNITLQPGAGDGEYSVGGYLYLMGATGGYYGGNVEARAGASVGYKGGKLILYGGEGPVYGGNIYLQPGYSVGTPGNLYIFGLPETLPASPNVVWKSAGALLIS